jgi:hypothetical protein
MGSKSRDFYSEGTRPSPYSHLDRNASFDIAYFPATINLRYSNQPQKAFPSDMGRFFSTERRTALKMANSFFTHPL